ncbi:hypothetical protein RRG08_040931 [Elysia crispata]|uniref:Uncharacterized protein n=1 Tax=Elysia crispata TaxID=231223 RepID=A0AAE1CKM6_9GAST|nr:hypothetical protein RRG08_040931 [Elysia crispata]
MFALPGLMFRSASSPANLNREGLVKITLRVDVLSIAVYLAVFLNTRKPDQSQRDNAPSVPQLYCIKPENRNKITPVFWPDGPSILPDEPASKDGLNCFSARTGLEN